MEERVDALAAEEEDDSRELQPVEDSEIRSGVDVLVKILNQAGRIVGEPSAGKVYVDVDGKRMKVPLDWLAQLPEGMEPEEPRDKVVVNVQTESTATYNLDLRGYRAEAAMQELNTFIDQALLSNLSQIQIIHGKGTGVIKKVVHEVLEGHRSVKAFRLGGLDEGGAGATFVELK